MKIVLTGSIAFDTLMTYPGYFKENILTDKLDSISLSFLVDSMVKQRGGIAPNIAFTMALFGQHPYLMATVGEDFEEFRGWLESKGINTSYVRSIKGEFTASFFVNTDSENNQIASFFPGAMSHAKDLTFHDMEEELPDLVVISPNDPEAMKKYVRECKALAIPYIYDPSQQIVRLSGDDLREGLKSAFAVFVNEYEFGLIEKKTGLTIGDVLEHVKFIVITYGEKGATLYAKDKQIQFPAISPEQILDPTGVGDAFRGGFLAGFVKNYDWELCGRMGALAATYCLEQRGPQNHTFTVKDFAVRYRQNFTDGKFVDSLLQ